MCNDEETKHENITKHENGRKSFFSALYCMCKALYVKNSVKLHAENALI